MSTESVAKPTATKPAAAEHERRNAIDLQFWGIRAVAAAVFLYGCVAVDKFASTANINAWLSSVALVGIAAVGMALITVGGQYFMLSMGATAAVSTIIFAHFLHLGVVPSLVITVLCGLAMGLFQGYCVGVRGSDPIITTIAASAIILGIGTLASGGKTVVGHGDASWLGQASILKLFPVQTLFFFAVAIVLQHVLMRSRYGREVRLIGSNREAAHLAGLRVNRTIVISYVLAAGCAALSGALLAAESGQGNLQLGVSFDFDAISAVLVGGIAVAGGRGSIFDAAFGALFIALVGNILLVKGYSFDIQLLVKGLILLAAISLGAMLSRRSR